MKRRIADTGPQPVEHLDAAASAELHRGTSYLDAALKVNVDAGLADVRRRAGTGHPRQAGQATQRLTRRMRQLAEQASCSISAFKWYASGIAESLLIRRTGAIAAGVALLAASVALIVIPSLGNAIAIPAAVGSVAGGFLISSLGSLVGEEAAQQLDRLPHMLIRLAARRLTRSVRQEIAEEWTAELAYLLWHEKAAPLTRVLLGVRYAAGLLIWSERIGRMAEARPPAEAGEAPARRRTRGPRRAVTQGIVLTAIGAAIIIVSVASGKDTAITLALVGLVMASIGVATLHESVGSNGQKGA